MPRLFVAIDLPEPIKDSLGLLAQGIPGARWVPRDQMHLTLRFIGDVDGAVFADVRAALGGVEVPAFSLALQGLGCFPPRGQPNVLWVGVRRSDELASFHAAVERAIVRAGVPPEHRKFHAHVTLARLSRSPVRRLADYLAGNGLFDTPAFPVTEVTLFSSTLSPKGAHHTVEAAYPLSPDDLGTSSSQDEPS